MPNPDVPRLIMAVLPASAPFSWRCPGCWALGDLDFDHYRHLAAACERGRVDLLFLGDTSGVADDRVGLAALQGFSSVFTPEPFALLGGLASITRDLGLVGTASTTYYQPYHLARKFATLDHMSRGRAGWNLVTSATEAEALNFGLTGTLSSAERYARAEECLAVVLDLWDSWEDEALLRDAASARYFDPGRVRRLEHRGRHFGVRGPLNLPRPPQGHPLLCQAGSSEAGWEVAARSADIMFGKVVSQAQARQVYAGVKGRLAAHGRAPDELKVLMGVVTVVGDSDREARAKFREIQSVITEQEGRGMLRFFVPGLDDPALDLDGPVPSSPELDRAAKFSGVSLSRDGVRLTLRELVALITAGYGHLTLVGTPGSVADTLASWVRQQAADGFNLMPHTLPGSLDDFIGRVVPALQDRGVYQTAYRPGTLREKLGLPRPANRWLARAASGA